MSNLYLAFCCLVRLSVRLSVRACLGMSDSGLRFSSVCMSPVRPFQSSDMPLKYLAHNLCSSSFERQAPSQQSYITPPPPNWIDNNRCLSTDNQLYYPRPSPGCVDLVRSLHNSIVFEFSFPHETLTPILGKPTNTTLQLLQRQLFTNASSVPSARGGGLHGHLAMLLRDADCIERAGVAFIVPVHPGPPPPPVGTSAVIAVSLRNNTLADVTL